MGISSLIPMSCSRAQCQIIYDNRVKIHMRSHLINDKYNLCFITYLYCPNLIYFSTAP